MKAKVLMHKVEKGVCGTIKGGVLYKTGSELIPQLFPDYATIEWIERSIQVTDFPRVKSINEFELIDAELKILI